MPQIRTCNLSDVQRLADVIGAVDVFDAGDALAVIVYANPTTGYEWQVESLPTGLSLVGQSHTAPLDDELVGAGGTHRFLFQAKDAVDAGEVVLRCVRPWMATDPNAAVAHARVRIGA